MRLSDPLMSYIICVKNVPIHLSYLLISCVLLFHATGSTPENTNENTPIYKKVVLLFFISHTLNFFFTFIP